jgi:hypothetical protein
VGTGRAARGGFAPAALIGLGVGLRSELQRSIKKRDQTLKADAVQQLDNEKVHQRSPSLFLQMNTERMFPDRGMDREFF